MSPARRLLHATVTVVTVTVVGLLLAGCSGSSPEAVTPASTAAAARQVGPEAFAAEVAGGDRFVVNVHTPDEGSIEGTDAEIPFDQLERRAAELPQGHDVALAVYCMTGSMSRTAVAT